MLSPLARAIAQLDDPAILRVLLKSLLLSALCFGLLCAGSVYGLHRELAQATGWVAWVIGALGGFAALIAALWLFLPVAVVIASLFLDPICRAVEKRWYPGLPPPEGAHWAAQLWDGLAAGLRVLALSLLSGLFALMIPGAGLLLGWAVTAWAIGRGMFMAVAMRRMRRRDAHALYARHRGAVLLQGAALALAGYVPLANLLVPILGAACMVHVLMQSGRTQ
jgi:uncharacterized protein involved in cysteine biosynthesis